MSMPPPNDDSNASMMRTLGTLSSVGIAFVLAVVIGAGFGYLLDRWLGTKFIFFLVFFFLGVVAGILNVVRTAARYTEEEKRSRGGRT